MDVKHYAHSLEGEPQDKWQFLDEHLKNVAKMAQSFADDFGAGDWGYLAGLWHNLGKYSKEFQKRLGVAGGNEAHIETKPGRVDHSTAGAQHAFSFSKDKGKMPAYAIAGHHSGLLGKKAGVIKKKRPLQKKGASAQRYYRWGGYIYYGKFYNKLV